MIRTEQIWLKPDKNIGRLCHISKNLFNQGNYIIRQELDTSGEWVRYNSLDKQLKDSDNYKSLPAQTAQQILRLLDKSWKSFFQSIKEWKLHPEKFKEKPGPPHYKKRNGEHILVFTNQQARIKDGLLKLPKLLELEIKTRLDDTMELREVRIIPRGVGYVLEIIYEKEVKVNDLDDSRVAGIDFGVRNLIAMANNIASQPIVVKGGVTKSVNQYYNKERSRLQRIYDSQGIKEGLKSRKLSDKRNRKIHDLFHKASRFVVNWCIENGIGTVVIGHNDDWKQKANTGKRNNQNFVQIPFHKLMHQIVYKGEENGIKAILQEESHTSKCSFLDNETVEHHDKYLGKRFKRGLFRSAKGIVINADIQAGYNIIAKAIPEAFKKLETDGIEGVGLHPKRVKSFGGL
ncbi:MAG: hypothetical protein DDT33_01580 [Firmicutes bacterium]|nr:hypothetical protein [Bacillota bacterium]